MSTVESEVVISKMLSSSGTYNVNQPRADAIYKYFSCFNGRPLYKIIWSGYIDNFMINGAYTGSPVCLMRDQEITEEGKTWLGEYSQKGEEEKYERLEF